MKLQIPENKHYFAFAVLLIVFLNIATKLPGLTYNMSLHPDEGVFYKAASSMADSILVPDAEYKEQKEYPEGAYIFQLPFHIAGKVIEKVFGIDYNAQVCGRISSLAYFVLAVVIGMNILFRYLGQSLISTVVYGITMTFSLFFIEHSRYGVGDMVSLFLLLSIIYLTAKAFSPGSKHSAGFRNGYYYAACAAGGAMGAVKYPQLLFVLIPICCVWYYSRKTNTAVMKKIVLSVLVTMISLLAFSPKALLDWGYFGRVINREFAAYVTDGTRFETGGY